MLTQGYSFNNSNSSFSNYYNISLTLNNIDSNEDLYLLSCTKDDNGWYVVTTSQIKTYYDAYGPFIIDNKVIFNNTGLDTNYYFVARLDK